MPERAVLRGGFLAFPDKNAGFVGHAALNPGLAAGNVRTRGVVLPGSNTTSLWLGPSVFAIFKNIAISGGVQAPVFRDASDSIYGREHVRFAINFSYLKYSAHTSSH